MAHPGVLHTWITTLPERGRYSFTRGEASAVATASPKAIQATLRRLKARGRIVSPRRGFYVVVPPEYRPSGCPPASWFIDHLMRHLGRNYYVSLLTAAALYGAGHQQPMACQVMCDASERDIEVGRVRIEFHVSGLMHGASTTRMQTETGTMSVATPETTAFDLVRFPAAAGHWGNIATVLAELAEHLQPSRLARGAARVPRSATQRLGWLLDHLGEGALADALESAIEGRRIVPTPLSTAGTVEGAPLDSRWKVLVNADAHPES